MEGYLLQSGKNGEGPKHPVAISDTAEKLQNYVNRIYRGYVKSERYFPLIGNTTHIYLNRTFYNDGICYDMFFIDPIEKI